MKNMVTFVGTDYEILKSHLFRVEDNREEAAFLIAGYSETDHKVNLLVREVIPVADSGFVEKGYAGLTIDPEFMMPILKRCRNKKLSVILVHSHPFSSNSATFSSIDDYGERVLMPKIQERIPERHHAAMVFGRSSIDARIWKSGKRGSEPVDIVKIVGENVEEIYPSSSRLYAEMSIAETYDRQILAFGRESQSRIQRTVVAIVGVGGIGSQVFQNLAHLGVGKIIAIDNDIIEESNRSRIVGSRIDDVKYKTPKTEVMKRLGKEINPKLETVAVSGSVNDLSIALKLREAGVIFCCTDTLTSRMVLNRIAYQYLIPVIDTGLDIQCSEHGKIRVAAGRVMSILPDGPCLECMGLLDAKTIQQELAQIERGETPHYSYISGFSVEAPSVISLNGVVASLAVNSFLNLLTGFEGKVQRTYQMYNVLEGTVKLYEMKAEVNCTLCKEVKALGDGVNLPCKLDQ